MSEVEAALEVADIARDVVALWKQLSHPLAGVLQ